MGILSNLFKLSVTTATKSDTNNGGSSHTGKDTDIHTNNKDTTIFIDRKKDGSTRTSEAPYNKKK